MANDDFHDAVDNVGDGIKKTVDNAHDRISQANNQAKADGEKANRELDDDMTPAERVGSMAREAKDRLAAGIDNAKVEARKNT